MLVDVFGHCDVLHSKIPKYVLYPKIRRVRPLERAMVRMGRSAIPYKLKLTLESSRPFWLLFPGGSPTCFGHGRGPITPPGTAMVRTYGRDLNSNKTSKHWSANGPNGPKRPNSNKTKPQLYSISMPSAMLRSL